MNEDDLGGYSPSTNNVLGTYSVAVAGAASRIMSIRPMEPDGS